MKTQVQVLDHTSEAKLQRSPEESIILGVMTLGDLLEKKGDNICQKYGVTTQQWLIMLHIANDPNIPYFADFEKPVSLIACELADALNVSRPNVTNLINSLINKDLVEHIANKRDRRRKHLALTEKGADLINRIEPQRRIANANLLEGLNVSDKEIFMQSLRFCLNKLAARQ